MPSTLRLTREILLQAKAESKVPAPERQVVSRSAAILAPRG